MSISLQNVKCKIEIKYQSKELIHNLFCLIKLLEHILFLPYRALCIGHAVVFFFILFQTGAKLADVQVTQNRPVTDANLHFGSCNKSFDQVKQQ